ncbi:uracil-DNA glycosylase [Sphaerosporella brunnea]|uniref:Uracil-DNA glycosylase n=1 Tax=Sphaerosporella brunnea TaxID=1250544 RepID=A0A5J5F0L1_9PEZI|nr:uracil-DNA glycosylase [Sphaerosporella brunnea]
MSPPTLKRKAPATPATPAKKTRSITSFFTPKQASASGPSSLSTALPKFDRAAWVSSLSEEQKSLLALEIETMHESWLGALKDELVSDGFLRLKKFLSEEKGVVYPPSKDIYSWSRYCPLDTVKVVILGQDPYHGPNQAMGLSFSVHPPTPAPPSLQNIYKGLKNDYPEFTAPPNRGGSLVPWAERGVLMLNACLTVRAGAPASHANKGWERLTGKALEAVAQRRKGGVVFMAWGAEAAKRVAKLDTKRHLVLKSVHPSPLSAMRGFFDAGHFKKANEWLELKYGDKGPINWSLHGSTPVGLRKEALKKATDVADADDEFGVHDEEAMVEAALKAEKAFTSRQKPDETQTATSSNVGATVSKGKEDAAAEENKMEEVEKTDIAKESRMEGVEPVDG